MTKGLLILLCLSNSIFLIGCDGGFRSATHENALQELASTGANLTGAGLYKQTCAACHGDISNSSKSNRSAQEIELALRTQPAMSHLSLTPGEVQSIAMALAGSSCVPNNNINPTEIQRLTHKEYLNSIQDYFGVIGNYTAGFQQDPVTAGFRKNSSALTISSLQTEDYYQAADRAISDVLGTNPGFIFTCTSGENCARSIFSRVASRVFRNPVASSDDEINQLINRVFSPSLGRGESFQESIKLGLMALLMSPQFLYHIYEVQGDPDSTGTIEPLTQHELAARLASFLWASLPDDRLVNLANQGTLSTNLDSEVKRMLADPKASSLTNDFAEQWFKLYKLSGASPDPTLFPQFNENIKNLMRTETETFFSEIVNQDKSLMDIVDARYSYMNQELAQYYGISGVSGSQFQQVDILRTQRVGVITQGSVLTLTSKSDRSDVIRRGFWVLENILCEEPPPPPQNVPALPPADNDGSLRARLDAHRSNPACFSCHSVMDPIGFGLEGFDGVGNFRSSFRDGTAIDDYGTMPDGTSFRGALDMVNKLKNQNKFQFCATKKLMTYALGRNPSSDEKCRARDIGNRSIHETGSFSDTIIRLINDPSFQNKAGGHQ